MKKIALTTMAICSALSTVAAHAQTSVTIYGQIDTAMIHETGMPKGANLTALESGALRASRLGFTGTEDLGGGLSTIFVLESGFSSTTGAQLASGIFGRKAYVGLSGGFGTVTAGRMYTLTYSTVDFFDPTLGIGGGSDNMYTRGNTRRSNNIRYDSPTFSGFSGSVTYATPQDTTSRGTEGLITYANGPLVIKLVRNDQNGANSPVGTIPTVDYFFASEHNTFLGAAYDFNVLKLSAGYEANHGLGGDQPTDAKYNVANVGVSVPTSVNSVVGATYTRAKDQAGTNNAHQYVIAYQYFLSKRTTLYTSYTHIHNQNDSLNYVTADAGGLGAGGTTEWNVGINHMF